MIYNRISVRATLVTLALVCALNPVAAWAVVTNLNQAKLKLSEAPPGFYGPTVKVYRHFADNMELGAMDCNSTSLGLSVSRWKESLIQAFQSKDPLAGLAVCSYLLDSMRDARTTYRDLQLTLSGEVGAGVAKPIKIRPKFGDGAYATWYNGEKVNGTTVPIWRIIFRHGLVVVYLEVDRPEKGFKATNLIRLGVLINGRLH